MTYIERNKIFNLKSLYLRDYYPYGKETTWEYWCCGKVDLREMVLTDEYINKESSDILLSIFTNVGRAMNYCEIQPKWGGEQKLIAHQMFRLFYGGDVEWNKEILSGKTNEEIEALEKFHEERSNRLYNKTSTYTPQQKLERRYENGIFMVNAFPLRESFYTKQELCAIDLLVDCEFENMC